MGKPASIAFLAASLCPEQVLHHCGQSIYVIDFDPLSAAPWGRHADYIDHALRWHLRRHSFSDGISVATRSAMASPSPLVQRWKTLYSQTLPDLAKARDPAQLKWPVTLDHCFARIILDNAIGMGEQQWDKVIKKPAVKNMTEEQLQAAIELGEMIMSGATNLEVLDEISLSCRGKNEGKYGHGDSTKEGASTKISGKRKAADEVQTSAPLKRQSTLPFASTSLRAEKEHLSSPDTSNDPKRPSASTSDTLTRISSSGLSHYRKRLYTILLSVPHGRYTTYAAMSDYLHSSARAVGNGMRNNPFAPNVPCHRVLAADGSIGGFGGSWGKEGMHAKKKLEMLRKEGVRFDSKGKVVGEPFRKFHEFEGATEKG
jgi:O-6-methylguanine DNA methyltransferase